LYKEWPGTPIDVRKTINEELSSAKMATQTRTSRQAAASKAAATRKRTTAKRSATRTKASAKRTASSARTTSRGAQRTARQAARTAGRNADTTVSRLEVFARQAERTAVLIPVGAALELRDAVVDAARTYTDRRRAKRRFDRFERRGETALRRNRRNLERQAKVARRDVEARTNGLRSDAEQVVERVRQTV
jgi:hypothetical protein